MRICNEDQRWEGGLRRHAKQSRHATYECVYEGCVERFCQPFNLKDHQLTAHVVADHGRIQPISAHSCHQCNQAFNSHADLHRHAREQRHASYACKCDQTFSRFDVLQRHLEQYLPGKPQYPCLYCKRHRGDDGFKRKQHLTQHLRGYHHIGAEMRSPFGFGVAYPTCPHFECPSYRGLASQHLSRSERETQKPFRTQGEFTKHMREVHDESPFPCDIAHCPRLGGKGYFREKDFLKHRKDQHPNAAPYALGERSVLLRCRELNCHRNGKNGFKDLYGLKYHYVNSHGYDDGKSWVLAEFPELCMVK